MSSIFEHSLALADIADGKAGSRPIYVLEYDGSRIRFLVITSQYKNKSKTMKKVYFPIEDWTEANLDKQSYIDVYQPYIISENRITLSPLGELTERDEENLWQFIEDRAYSM